jgi:hypothetical protein
LEPGGVGAFVDLVERRTHGLAELVGGTAAELMGPLRRRLLQTFQAREAQMSSGFDHHDGSSERAPEQSRERSPADGLAAAPVTPDAFEWRALSAARLRELQRTIGNTGVGRLLRAPTGSAGARSRPTLSEALEFESRFENPASWANPLRHPITHTLIRLMRGELFAKFVDHDTQTMASYGSAQGRLVRSLWRSLEQLLDFAPSPWTFQGEALVIGSFLREIENTILGIAVGSWSRGREDAVIRSLQLFDASYARVVSGGVRTARAGRHLPGATLQRRVYVGTIVIPEVICNFFLALDVTFPAAEGAGSVKLGAGDRVGDAHTVEQSRSVELGGPGGGASVEIGARGPEGAGAHKKVTGPGGTEATGAVTLGSDGKPEASVEVGGEHGKAKLGTRGIDAEFTAAAGDWNATAAISSDGSVRYSATHPTLGGVSISGSMDKATLGVVAPELEIGGVKVQPQLIVELWPARLAYSRTQTQTPEAVRAFRLACLPMLAIAAAPAAAAAAAGLVVVLAEGAPVLVQGGRMLLGAAAAP